MILCVYIAEQLIVFRLTVVRFSTIRWNYKSKKSRKYFAVAVRQAQLMNDEWLQRAACGRVKCRSIHGRRSFVCRNKALWLVSDWACEQLWCSSSSSSRSDVTDWWCLATVSMHLKLQFSDRHPKIFDRQQYLQIIHSCDVTNHVSSLVCLFVCLSVCLSVCVLMLDKYWCLTHCDLLSSCYVTVWWCIVLFSLK